MKVIRGKEEVVLAKVWGGICWPGESYGYCCAVGEELIPQVDEINGYWFRLFFLEERVVPGRNKNKLIDAALGLRERFKIERFYGRGYHDRENERFLTDWNRNIKTRSEPNFSIGISYGSETDSIEAQYSVLSNCLNSNNKTLFWANSSKVQEEMLNTKNASGSDMTCVNFPAIAGCGYVLMMLRMLKRETMPTFFGI